MTIKFFCRIFLHEEIKSKANSSNASTNDARILLFFCLLLTVVTTVNIGPYPIYDLKLTQKNYFGSKIGVV
jgi:hypothetical protein